jgi:hypothetical protein
MDGCRSEVNSRFHLEDYPSIGSGMLWQQLLHGAIWIQLFYEICVVSLVFMFIPYTHSFVVYNNYTKKNN